MEIIKRCSCCHKNFEVKTAKAYQRIFCNECAKKIKREVRKRRMKEIPLISIVAFWTWNITTPKEVDEIVENIQKEFGYNE